MSFTDRCSNSLLQQTANRTRALDVSAPIVICNEDHWFLIAQQLQKIGLTKASVVLKLNGRNTVPAFRCQH
jgi:mannose-1-phosphate guanylyltransferase